MKRGNGFAAVLSLALPALLAGCEALGDKEQKALYDLPKDKRVLVFVDVRQAVSPPAGYAAQLGEKISDQLFAYHVLDHVVPQSRIMELKRDPEKFSAMHVADVARATDADVVIFVDLYTFNVTDLSDDTVTQGFAQTLVKVIDSSGARLWPLDEVPGTEVDAKVDPAFSESRDKAETAGKIADKLARDIGRLFHSYNLNESTMEK